MSRTMEQTEWELVLKTAATVNPITDAQAKEHLHLGGVAGADSTDEDAYVTAIVTSATKHIEALLGKQLVRATFNLYLDEFPTGRNPIIFPVFPVSALTSVTYEDENSASQTWTSGDTGYQVAIAGNDKPAVLCPSPDESYPATEANRKRAVNILFNAGYSDTADSVANIPENYTHAVKLMVGHMYEMREPVIAGVSVAQVPDSVHALLGTTAMVALG